jgi:hypothetical protein
MKGLSQLFQFAIAYFVSLTYFRALQPLTKNLTACILSVRKFWSMSKGEGQFEAGNPDVLVAVSVVALNGSSQRQPPHRPEGVSGVL